MRWRRRTEWCAPPHEGPDGGLERGVGRGREPRRFRTRPASAISSVAGAPDASSPTRRQQRPDGYQQFAQLFDHPRRPDLCVIDSASHNWEKNEGGDLGEHGRRHRPGQGPVRGGGRRGGIAWLADFSAAGYRRGADGRLRRRRQRPRERLLFDEDGVAVELVVASPAGPATSSASSSTGPTRTCSTYLAMRGEARTLPGLMSEGTACRYGALASLLTVTLANHTGTYRQLTRRSTGTSSNAGVDRASGRTGDRRTPRPRGPTSCSG